MFYWADGQVFVCADHVVLIERGQTLVERDGDCFICEKGVGF